MSGRGLAEDWAAPPHAPDALSPDALSPDDVAPDAGPTDTELAHAAAAGEQAAFDELYRRYSDSAWRVAYAVAGNPDDAADAVAEAFTRMLAAVKAGRISEVKRFGPYVLAATRNAAIDTLRRSGRVRPTAEDLLDTAAPARGVPGDRILDQMDASLVASAFRSLPERWRSVLWLTAVEGIAPGEAAHLLGVTPNGAAQLAVRARAGLRERFLQAHLRGDVDSECRFTVARLGAYVGGGLPPRDVAKVDQHLADCAACAARRDELEDVGTTLRRVVVPIPLVLGALAWHHWLRTSAKEASRTKPIIPAQAQRTLTGASLGLLGLGIIGASIVGQSPLSALPQGRPAGSVPVGATPVLIAEASAATAPPAAPLPLVPGPALSAALASLGSGAAGSGAGGSGATTGAGAASAGSGSASGSTGGGGSGSPVQVPGVSPAGQPGGSGGGGSTLLQLSGDINLAPAPVQVSIAAGTSQNGVGLNLGGQSTAVGNPPPASGGSSSSPSVSGSATTPTGTSSASVPPPSSGSSTGAGGGTTTTSTTLLPVQLPALPTVPTLP
ncbi:MAG TPA: sigma-70 family RNA polymerase sigma factor [Acidimicrobiales bacterium]|nr:sigma-70 family RNA polymerase sigma factor [Acidimicrobiales bacterium]